MSLKRVILSSTALAVIGLVSAVATAAEVKPQGALDINIGGFARWYAFVGDLKEKNRGQNGSYDFRNDTEVHVYARGKDEASGLTYGANIELEADGSEAANADEEFVFIGGAFGEFRFGDQNGVSEQMKVGASTLAAFAGGLDSVGVFDYPALVYGVYSDDSTKIAYYSPTIAGFQLGLSFTPHVGDGGTSIGTTDGDGNDIDDYFEGGVSYAGEFGDFSVLAAVTGAYGHLNDSGPGDEDVSQIYGGLNVGFRNFKIGGSYGWQKGASPITEASAGNDRDPDTGEALSYIGDSVFQAGARQRWYTLGASAALGPANVSLNWGQVLASRVGGGTPNGDDPEPYALIFGADFGLAPGLVVGGELAYFENSDNTASNDGVLGIAGVRVAF